MSISGKTPIGLAQEITNTKKGRSLDQEVISFSDSYFDAVTSAYWDQIAPKLEEELEDELPSELEDDGLEILQNRYEQKEEKLDDRLREMETYINGLGVEGLSNGLSIEESYTLGLNLAKVMLESHIDDKRENILHIPDDGVDYFNTESDVPDLLRGSPKPVYEPAHEIQRVASEVVETEMGLYDIDVPDEDQIRQYRQEKSSN